MAVVRNRTELKGRGRFTLPPDTSVIAMASPMALPTPSTTAVAMPGAAAGSTARNQVCTLDAPSANDASLTEGFTARMDASLILITVGSIITASTMAAEIKFAPPVNRWVPEPANSRLSSLYIHGFNR